MKGRVTITEALPWMRSRVPYFVPSVDQARLVADLTAAGFDVRELDGRAVRDERSLVQALGPALSFPDYYGGNWDAFVDCVGDLAETADASIALVWTAANQLARSDLHAFTRAIHLILSTAESLALSEVAFQLELIVVGDFGPQET